MVTTRYVVCSNEIANAIKDFNNSTKESTKFSKGKDGDVEYYQIYISPIIEAFNRKTGKVVKSKIVTLKDWVYALNSVNAGWANISTFEGHYNRPYKWKEISVNPEASITVHYVDGNGNEIQGNSSIKETFSKPVSKLMLNSKSYGKEEKNLYKSYIKSGGDYWIISGFYAAYGKKPKAKDAVSELQATGILKAMVTQGSQKEEKLTVTKDNRDRTLNMTNLKGKTLSYDEYETKIAKSKISLEGQDATHLYLCYQLVDQSIRLMMAEGDLGNKPNFFFLTKGTIYITIENR